MIKILNVMEEMKKVNTRYSFLKERGGEKNDLDNVRCLGKEAKIFLVIKSFNYD